MELDKLKDISSKILKVGKYKLIVDTEKVEQNKKLIKDAITRDDVRKIILQGVIKKKQDTGHSRGSARILLEKKKLKRKRGPGKRKGTPKARQTTNLYNLKVRGLRKKLSELKKENKLNDKNYHKLYLMVKGNFFRGKKHLEEYINGENK
jgi:large subunit ribosomal protein L19e